MSAGMSCFETIQAYGLRSIGIGERALPKADITVCEQITLIGSGMIWNIYFGVLALVVGFVFAQALAVAKFQGPKWLAKPADWFIYLFRGSPLFIQFFLAYEALSLLPRGGVDLWVGLGTIHLDTAWMTRAWAGGAFGLGAQYLGLCGGDFPRRAAIDPQRRSGSGGCLRALGLEEVQTGAMADDDAAGVARLYQ